jgi:hypothetical protein
MRAHACVRTHKIRTHNRKLTTERSQGMSQDLNFEEGIILDPWGDDKLEDEPATGGREERSNKTPGYRRLPEFIPRSPGILSCKKGREGF